MEERKTDIEKRLFDGVLNFFTTNKIDAKSSKFIVGFSGGADSLCLLYLMKSLFPTSQIKAVYINHKIRPSKELEKELQLNKNNCSKIGIPLTIIELEDGQVSSLSKKENLGEEAACRILRYKKLESFCQAEGFDYILTAHNRTDQLETVAMRLIKGSALTSLRGIYPIRGKIIRPVLELERKDFEIYLKSKGFTWSEDSTNSNNKYLRNYIRNDLFLKLKKIMPEYDKSLLLIQKKVEKACMNFDKDFQFDGKGIDLDEFRLMNNFHKELLLFSYWDEVFYSEEKGLEVSLSRKNVSRIIEATNNKKGISMDFSKAIVCITKNRLFILNKNELEQYPKNWSFELDLTKEREIVNLPYGLCLKRGFGNNKMNKDIKNNPQIFLFNEDLKGKVRVSNYENGDTIQLKSGTKKISRLLQDFGIPSVLRKFVPVIYDEKQAVAVMAAFFGGKDRICKVCSGHKEINLLYLYIIDKE